MTEAEKRKHRICFTGHRPEKLKMDENTLYTVLKNAIEQGIRDGFTTYISGMARGVDIVAAEIVLEIKKSKPELRLICALPHPNFEIKWSDEWQHRYKAVLARADLVKTICPAYERSAYQKRNEWLVDHSARVIAVYNGEPGGTKNTIDYAEKHGIPIVYASL